MRNVISVSLGVALIVAGGAIGGILAPDFERHPIGHYDQRAVEQWAADNAR